MDFNDPLLNPVKGKKDDDLIDNTFFAEHAVKPGQYKKVQHKQRRKQVKTIVRTEEDDFDILPKREEKKPLPTKSSVPVQKEQPKKTSTLKQSSEESDEDSFEKQRRKIMEDKQKNRIFGEETLKKEERFFLRQDSSDEEEEEEEQRPKQSKPTAPAKKKDESRQTKTTPTRQPVQESDEEEEEEEDEEEEEEEERPTPKIFEQKKTFEIKDEEIDESLFEEFVYHKNFINTCSDDDLEKLTQKKLTIKEEEPKKPQKKEKPQLPPRPKQKPQLPPRTHKKEVPKVEEDLFSDIPTKKTSKVDDDDDLFALIDSKNTKTTIVDESFNLDAYIAKHQKRSSGLFDDF